MAGQRAYKPQAAAAYRLFVAGRWTLVKY